MKVLLSALTAAGLSAAVAAWTAPAPTTEYVVRIEKNFMPDLIEVKVGDSVNWRNFDADSHTVTADFRPACPPDGSFDSGEIPSAGAYLFRFGKIGRYKYYCRLHKEMTGTVVVTQ